MFKLLVLTCAVALQSAAFAADQADSECRVWSFWGNFQRDYRSDIPIRDASGHMVADLFVGLKQGSLAEGWRAGILYRSAEFPEWKTAEPLNCIAGVPGGYPSSADQCHFVFSAETLTSESGTLEFISFIERNGVRIWDHNGDRAGNGTLPAVGRFEAYACR